MISLKRILLPTDFSEYSAEATTYACALAEQFDSELHLLYVVNEDMLQIPSADTTGFSIDRYIDEATAQANRALDTLLDRDWEARRRDRIVRQVRRGGAFVEIVRYAREYEIDLVVIGTHGRSGLAHVLIGSVAERVVRKAPCPVLTVRPTGHQFVMP